MRILLAIDDSACSAAATTALMSQFSPDHAEVQVLHLDEWPKDLPPAMAFAEGPAAAECAKEWDADVVVPGSHGKRGLDRLILGSVSDSVARHARCSVEIVRTAPNVA